MASPYGGIVSPAVVGQDSNIIRTYGNLGQVATQAKTIATPFSTVTKSDVRVSNPGYLAGPALAHGYAAPHLGLAPAYHGIAAPAYHGIAAPALAHGYAAPIAKVGYPYGYPAVAPAVAKVGVAPAASLLGKNLI